MNRKKISIIGAGFTGATTALFIAQKNLGDVVLLDIPAFENPTKGKSLDMQQASAILEFDVGVKGTSDYSDTASSDLVIITAGVARKPGMTRDDLVQTNKKILQSVSAEVARYSPECTIIVLTNPVDAMTYTVYKSTGFPKNRVIGQSGVLDTARFKTFIAKAAGVSVRDVTGIVLGGHGDDMVPLLSNTYIGGIPVGKFISNEKLEEIVERTRFGGREIVELLGNGSAYYAPAASLAEMAEAILLDQKRVLPSIAYLDGEYGFEGIYLGVPAVIGSNGIEAIIELDLSAEEKSALELSAGSVKSVIEIL